MICSVSTRLALVAALAISLPSEDDDIAALTRRPEAHEWAGARDLVVPIKRPEAEWDPSCPR